jgi:hypothetical protein
VDGGWLMVGFKVLYLKLIFQHFEGDAGKLIGEHKLPYIGFLEPHPLTCSKT